MRPTYSDNKKPTVLMNRMSVARDREHSETLAFDANFAEQLSVPVLLGALYAVPSLSPYTPVIDQIARPPAISITPPDM